MRNFDWAQMAGNSSEMTVAESKPQDSVSRAREPDTAGPAAAAAAYGLNLDSPSLPASWNRSSFTRRLLKLFCDGGRLVWWVRTDSNMSFQTNFGWCLVWETLAGENRLCFAGFYSPHLVKHQYFCQKIKQDYINDTFQLFMVNSSMWCHGRIYLTQLTDTC